MPKATFEEFIAQNPICKIFVGNPDAVSVFNLLSQDDNIIKMIDASAAGRPALTPCVHPIEEYVDGQTNPALDLTNDFTRQAVGRMVKTVLGPFGYKPERKKSLPKDISARYFTSASCYVLDPIAPATMRVARRVVEI